MRNALVRVTGLVSVLAIGLVGCGGADGPETAGEGGGIDNGVPNPSVGQSAPRQLAYPKGAKGFSVGSVIQNYQLVGFANHLVNGDTDLQPIQLADFYNPTGDGVFNATDNPSFVDGAPKPKALLIDVASVWCGPCNEEADVVLPPKYANFQPKGGEFLLQLADSNTPGEPATVSNLKNWTKKYEVNYPATIDPTYKLGALFEQDAFPANFIIDTRTMTIVEAVAGEPQAAFWSKFQAVIDGTY